MPANLSLLFAGVTFPPIVPANLANKRRVTLSVELCKLSALDREVHWHFPLRSQFLLTQIAHPSLVKPENCLPTSLKKYIGPPRHDCRKQSERSAGKTSGSQQLSLTNSYETREKSGRIERVTGKNHHPRGSLAARERHEVNPKRLAGKKRELHWQVKREVKRDLQRGPLVI